MRQIYKWELLNNNEKIFIEYVDGTYKLFKVYHIGDEGILCDDLETYIKTNTEGLRDDKERKTKTA